MEERLHKQLSDFREEGEWFDIHNSEYLHILKEFGFETAQNVFDAIEYNEDRISTLETIISTQDDIMDDLFYMIKVLRNRHDDLEYKVEDTIENAKFIVLGLVILIAIGVVF